MTNSACLTFPTRDMTLDLDVVGRVSEHHLRLFVPEQLSIAFGMQGVAAINAMLTKLPEVTGLAYWRGTILNGR